MTSNKTTLKCVPFELVVDNVFWHLLAQKKLQNYRLEEGPFPITGHFEIGYFKGSACRVSLDFRAFDDNFERNNSRSFLLHGQLFIFNTLEKFKDNLLQQKNLLERGEWLKDTLLNHSHSLCEQPNSLLQFMLLVHADLKKHLFRFRSAFPTLGLEPAPQLLAEPVKLKTVWSENKISHFINAWDDFASQCEDFMFFVKEEGENIQLYPLKTTAIDDLGNDQVYLCVCDPCTQSNTPGWTLRTALTLISAHFIKENSIHMKVLCLRDRVRSGIRQIGHSLFLRIEIHRWSEIEAKATQVWGWENLAKPWHFLNLSATMDPGKLAESAVNLNLELMRWRLLPQLNLNIISAARCLLFGCGTLGCNVARQLLAWGVRRISLIDYGTVSYSNPVRQTLFEHADCHGGGQNDQSSSPTTTHVNQGPKSKAQAAADALRRIFPGVEANAYSMSVPMPGHAVSALGNENIIKTQKDCELIEDLVAQHDVIFLLLDSREGRWLPTILARKHHKLVINAALGFDSYLVMRHGVLPPTQPSSGGVDSAVNYRLPTVPGCTRIPGDELGCYFCSDVVGPSNSLKDRSLDQQCTVTRPGLSMIAAALAVEMMVSILQRPSGPLTSADVEDVEPEEESPLGLVPHQIRGYLSKHSIIIPSVRAFRQCTACSPHVLNRLDSDGFQFLLRVFDDPGHLEEITGLKKLQEETNNLEDDIGTWSDDDVEFEEEEEEVKD